MKARLLAPLAGPRMWEIGEIVEGDDAVALCAAGLAIPVVEVEAVETAEIEAPVEKRTKSRAKPASE